NLAESWDLSYQVKVAVNLKETEAAAREWRYQALTEIAETEQISYVVTGHTQSDRAETLLYNLIRGSGSEGLTALSWQRELTPNLQLVRPILNISRSETAAFCQQLDLPVWDDQVNENLDYARNRMRREVIPYLQTHFNPQVEKNLAQTADILAAEVDYLEALTQAQFQSVLNSDRTQLHRPSLRSQPLALQRRLIRQFLQLNLPHAPNFEQIEAIVNLISAPNLSTSSSLPGNQGATVRGDWLLLIPFESSPN
ncbi:MAG: tRNA lysidine(34) synthetase TilS, partial [Microcystaceae cyanobacterium]